MRTQLARLLLALTAWAALWPAQAETIRCGNKLVYVGDSLYTVRSKCGEPDEQSHRNETRTVMNEVMAPCASAAPRARCSRAIETSVEVPIDEWTYDFGRNHFIQYLRFEDGKLVSITDGEYGHKSQD